MKSIGSRYAFSEYKYQYKGAKILYKEIRDA